MRPNKDQLNLLSNADLKRLLTDVEDLLHERDGADICPLIYDSMRTRFQATQRFSATQVFFMRPWKNLDEKKRRQFKASWDKAIKSFEEHGFENTPYLRERIIDTVVKSPFFEDKLEFQKILDSLDAAFPLLCQKLPGASTLVGLEFIKDLFNGRAKSSIARKLAEKRAGSSSVRPDTLLDSEEHPTD
jgi:hypothetical protein